MLTISAYTVHQHTSQGRHIHIILKFFLTSLAHSILNRRCCFCCCVIIQLIICGNGWKRIKLRWSIGFGDHSQKKATFFKNISLSLYNNLCPTLHKNAAHQEKSLAICFFRSSQAIFSLVFVALKQGKNMTILALSIRQIFFHLDIFTVRSPSNSLRLAGQSIEFFHFTNVFVVVGVATAAYFKKVLRGTSTPGSGTFSGGWPCPQPRTQGLNLVTRQFIQLTLNPHSNESFEFKTDTALREPSATGRHRSANRAGNLLLEHLCSISKQSPLHQQTVCPMRSQFWIFEGEKKINLMNK